MTPIVSVEGTVGMMALMALQMPGGTSGGHRTLLYGHAVQLKHTQSGHVSWTSISGRMRINQSIISKFQKPILSTPLQFLSCLSSSTSSDKLAFDVGLQESNEGLLYFAVFLFLR